MISARPEDQLLRHRCEPAETLGRRKTHFPFMYLNIKWEFLVGIKHKHVV